MSTQSRGIFPKIGAKLGLRRREPKGRRRAALRLEMLETRQLMAADVSPFVQMGEIGVGGRIDSISVQPGNSDRVLIGGDMLGVGYTDDGGQSWNGTHDGWLNYNASDFTWDPNNPGHVWAGTLGGPHFSSDYGQTWEARRDGLPPQKAFTYAAPIEKILIDPLNPQRLLAVEGDHRFILNNRPFVFSGNVRISVDGGQTWDNSLTANIGMNRNIVDAQFTTDTRVVLVARDDAIYISEASGAAGSWVRQPFNLPNVEGATATSIAVDPTNAERMWVTLFDHGVIRSDDGGITWEVVGVGELPLDHRAGYYIVEPSVDAQGNVTLFLGNAPNNGGNGIFRSEDGGDTWTRVAGMDDEFGDPIPVVNGDIHAAGISAFWLEVDPNDPNTIWSGSSSRVIRSVDGGDTWVDMMNDNGEVEGTYSGRGYTGWVSYNAEFNPFDHSEIVLQGMDSAKLLISEDGGESWRLERDGLSTPYRAGTDIVYFSENVAYASFGQWGQQQVVARTTDGGHNWTQLNLDGVSFERPDGTTANEFRAVRVDSTNEDRVWALATSGLFYTENASDPANTQWQKIELDGTPLNMVADPFDNDGLYVMTSSGMYYSFDGTHFDFLTGSPQHITGNRRFIGLEADPNRDGVVYLANEDSGSQTHNGLWRFEGLLRDNANDVPPEYSSANWTRLGIDSWGSSANRWIRAVAVDPTDSNRIVVGTNKDPFADLIEATGVWFSEDGGQSFRQINDGLGMLRINAATFSPDGSEIIVGTGGRGWYKAAVTTTPTDNEPPRAQIHVNPDQLGSVNIGFTESVWGFELEDLELTRDGQRIELDGAYLQGMGENSFFVLYGLNEIATEPGNYILRVDASESGIADFAGNAMVEDAEDSFTVSDNTPPTVEVSDVPTGDITDSIDFFFSESVQGFDLGDLLLTRDGQVVDLTGANLQGMGEATFFELSGLRDIIKQEGEYRLLLNAAASGITDFAGNALNEDAIEDFSIVARTYDFDRQAKTAVVIPHQEEMQLANGSLDFTFNADTVGGTLLAKDASGNANGDLQINYIRQGNANRLRVNFFHGGRDVTLTSHRLQNGVDYDVQLRFGQSGLRLFVNGTLMGRSLAVRGGLDNLQDIVLGASNASSTRGINDRITSFFDGRIGGLTIRNGIGEVVFSDIESA